MAYDNKPFDDSKIRKGQAINLAFMIAIADGKQHDNEFIARQFLRSEQMIKLLQKSDPDQLASVVSGAKIMELMAKLDEEVSK